MLPIVSTYKKLMYYAVSVYQDLHLNKPSPIIKYPLVAGIAALCAVRHANVIFARRQIYMPYLEIMVTQRCSLNCKNCANLMNLFENPVDFPVDAILEDTRSLLNAVQFFGRVRILGGEPFLYKDLQSVIDLVAESKKVRRIEIVTNGTIVPSQNLIHSLQKKKVFVYLSAYGTDIAKKLRKS